MTLREAKEFCACRDGSSDCPFNSDAMMCKIGGTIPELWNVGKRDSGVDPCSFTKEEYDDAKKLYIMLESDDYVIIRDNDGSLCLHGNVYYVPLSPCMFPSLMVDDRIKLSLILKAGHDKGYDEF